MSVLTKLREKYKFNGGSYEPKPDCKFCKGTGEKPLKNGKLTFCICLYIEHDLSDFAGDSLAELAKKLKKEMLG